MYLRRPISFSFTGGTSARFFALRGLTFEDLPTVSAYYKSDMMKETYREALPVSWPVVRDMIEVFGQRV